eukprot:6407762-Amphidinium_carterae.2
MLGQEEFAICMSCCWLLPLGNARLISNHIVNKNPHTVFDFSCALVFGALAWDILKRHGTDDTMMEKPAVLRFVSGCSHGDMFALLACDRIEAQTCKLKLLMSKKRGTYVGRFKCLQEDGPNVVVALCGRDTDVRWKHEFTNTSAELAKGLLDSKLCAAELGTIAPFVASRSREWKLYGFAVVASWRVSDTRGAVLSAQNTSLETPVRDVLRNVLFGQFAKKPKAVIELPVHAAVALPIALPITDDAFLNVDMNASLEGPSVAASLWQLVGNGTSEVVYRDHDGYTRCPFVDVLQRWVRDYTIQVLSSNIPGIVGWRVWSPIAALMAHNAWDCDIVVVTERLKGTGALRLRVEAPPQKLLQQYLAQVSVTGTRERMTP